ncbi:endonuclease domain-containing protein [Sphingorhabdus arenilitoris]|uniref:Endonuclease domain-containing protein n=1 Tax=Sphingorhabdus arenilitoris TaxID=1490041 RepID=A0ABV8RJT0_9SPHN
MITGSARTVKLARKLRSEMSLTEAMLWRELRTRPSGLKFRRQHPAGAYVLDFYCAAARLAIEVDGCAHDSIRAAQADAARSHFLRSQHVATLRVPAKAVLEDLEAVVVRIVDVCLDRVEKINKRRENSCVPLHHPADGPPPRDGEEL